MKKRPLEFLAIVVVVAAVVGFTRSGPSTAEVSSPVPVAHSTTVPTASSPPAKGEANIGVPAPGQTKQATALWKSLFDEAQAFLAQGDNDSAEARLVAALKLAPMAGPEALHQTLDGLGLVCYRLGDYERSAEYQSRAIKAAAQLPTPQNSATVALYQTRYALALQALDRRDAALTALARARNSYKVAYPAGSPAYSEAMNSLAAQHRSMGDNEGAASLVEE